VFVFLGFNHEDHDQSLLEWSTESKEKVRPRSFTPYSRKQFAIGQVDDDHSSRVKLKEMTIRRPSATSSFSSDEFGRATISDQLEESDAENESGELLPSKRIFAEISDQDRSSMKAQPLPENFRAHPHSENRIRKVSGFVSPWGKDCTGSRILGPSSTNLAKCGLTSRIQDESLTERDDYGEDYQSPDKIDASCQTTQAVLVSVDFSCQCELSPVTGYDLGAGRSISHLKDKLSTYELHEIKSDLQCQTQYESETCLISNPHKTSCHSSLQAQRNYRQAQQNDLSPLSNPRDFVPPTSNMIQNKFHNRVTEMTTIEPEFTRNDCEEAASFHSRLSNAANIDFLLNGVDEFTDKEDSSKPSTWIDKWRHRPESQCKVSAQNETTPSLKECLKCTDEMFEIGINHIAQTMASRIYQRIESSANKNTHDFSDAMDGKFKSTDVELSFRGEILSDEVERSPLRTNHERGALSEQ
jgi:hypothetical protein